MGRASVPTPAVYPAFFFVLEKAVKSAGNAVIPTFPAHCPHGLQHLRHKRPTLAFSGENGYTLGPAQRIAHKGTHGETGAFRTGPLSLPSDCFTRCGNPAWPGGRTANFAPFGSWPGVRSRRTQRACGAAMRLCASLLRGVAAPLGCVIFFASAEIAVCTSCAQAFCVLREHPRPRPKRGKVCRSTLWPRRVSGPRKTVRG